jgi:hypothetical protein
MMNELLSKLFRIEDYSQIDHDGLSHYLKGDQAHFFVIELKEDELKNLGLRSKDDDGDIKIKLITDAISFKAFIEHFDQIVKSNYASAEKNSSLLIITKVDSLEKIDDYKQQILLVEEDENYLKKFVLLYTDKALKSIDENISLDSLQESVLNKDLFDSYYNNGYKPELEDYLFLLQLFVKLPFLKLKSGDEDFKALDTRLKEKLGASGFSIFNDLVYNAKKIESFDFEKGSDSELDNLLKLLGDD